MGVDVEVALIAARQHRVVTLDQLRGAGLSREAIRHRVTHGRLQRLWRGVYLVGPERPGLLSLALGAALACDGVLEGLWAAWLWGFGAAPSLPVTVTVVGAAPRARSGIKIRRTTQTDATRRRNIPVTTPAQTCLDLAATQPLDHLERLVAEAQVKGLLKESHLRDLIVRNRGRRGVANIGAVLDDGPRYTRAESERRLLALLREADLPISETNAKLLGYEADFLWRDHRLIVEVDGFAVHGTRRAFERDRRRNADLIAAGYRVMQVTWRQLTNEPVAVAARIAAALTRW